MNSNLQAALREYLQRRDNPQVDLRADGFYEAPEDNKCPLCETAKWSCGTGAHLKSLEHYALRNNVDVKLMILATKPQAYGASNIAWKSLRYTESSYLTSRNDFKWLPQEVNYAICDVDHEVPEISCSCGLYFFWSPWSALEYYGDGIVVRCEIGGKTIEATKGCICEAAVITGIYHEGNSERAQEMSEMYQVPLVDTQEDYDVIEEL